MRGGSSAEPSDFELLDVSGRRTSSYARALCSIEGLDGVVGQSRLLTRVLEQGRRVATTDMPVLITGETGTGKEPLARAIHRQSRRSSRPLVSVNLAAVPETLAAAELFGHERGAFTGADRLRLGRFETADRGTLSLDEIGELRADLQVLLLRVLAGGGVRASGWRSHSARGRTRDCGHKPRPRGRDAGGPLFAKICRLSVFPIHVPALRERPEDIPVLAQYFLQHEAARVGAASAVSRRARCAGLLGHG